MDSTCAHALEPPVSEAALRASLDHGAEIAAQEGEKWTASRARVYELLLRARGPVKAYDLIPVYAADRETKPPTVYRALDFLEAIGLAHRIPSLSAYTACRGVGQTHAGSFLICTCCGSAEEIAPDLDVLVSQAAAGRGFRPVAATLEIRGVCRRCQG
jgi:Fur family zinc uptake transcriptional regulator